MRNRCWCLVSTGTAAAGALSKLRFTPLLSSERKKTCAGPWGALLLPQLGPSPVGAGGGKADEKKKKIPFWELAAFCSAQTEGWGCTSCALPAPRS